MKRATALTLPAAACAALVCGAIAAAAHHSGAMYDSANPIDIKGEVKAFRWTNPHVYLELYGTSKDKPEPQVWSVEFSSPANIARTGWSRKSLVPGDKITVSIAPIRGGGPGGAFRELTFDATGKKMDRGSLRSQTAPAQ